MKLTLLGTRGEIELRSPRHRLHSSLLVLYRRTSLVVDCGFDWLERMSGLRARALLLTHAHPDHMFGLAVLKQAFPEAKILALPGAIAAAKTGWPARQRFWVTRYGNNIPGPDPVLPEDAIEICGFAAGQSRFDALVEVAPV